MRKDGRMPYNTRKIKAAFDVFGYAPGSVLFEIGNTKVLCSASLQKGVPQFLKGTRTGWLTAEYSMLPTSSAKRILRESSLMRKNGRNVEISRLIGRSLRAIVNLESLGERTIYIDCDVLQADGGTRTASITGACLALRAAVDFWLKNKIIKEDILIDSLAAISVGILDGVEILDINFQEDSSADADFNFVVTKSNKIVEIQGGAEGKTISWDQFEKCKKLACIGIEKLLKNCDDLLNSKSDVKSDVKSARSPLFSLTGRQQKIVEK